MLCCEWLKFLVLFIVMGVVLLLLMVNVYVVVELDVLVCIGYLLIIDVVLLLVVYNNGYFVFEGLMVE